MVFSIDIVYMSQSARIFNVLNQDKQEKQGKAQGEAYEKMLSDENFLPSHEEVI